MRHLNGMPRRRFLQALPSLPLLPVWGSALSAEPAGEKVIRRLRFNLGLHNPFAHSLSAQRLWCYLPAGPTTSQRLTGIHVSTGHRLLHDRLAHNILELGFDDFPAYASKLVQVICDVELHAAAASHVLDDAETWLQPERFVESDDPAIRRHAAMLQRDSPASSARAIYDWVHGNITYAGYIAPDLGARYALAERRGDCTEYAGLVVALARALDIPARVIGGYVANHDLVLRPDGYHNWADLHVDGAWRVVDAQKGNWDASPQRYIGFRIHSPVPVNVLGSAHRYRLDGELRVQL